MIKGDEKISEVFSIFHDGGIAAYHIAGDNLELEIEISYLTQRINQAYTKFFLSLHNARDFSFSTWPHDVNAAPAIIHDPSQIFAGEPEILSSEVKNGLIEVVMNQHSTDYDYCGGYLSFKADAAQVADEGGKQYDVNELGQICEDYWNEWSNKNKR